MHYRDAPAKVNLSLHLVGPRPDGFTEIETLITPIDLADRLGFEPDEHGPMLECSDPELPVDESNLVMRAAKAFGARVPGGAKVRIRLEKRIPHGAGLGGGSSDAAATLLALNDLAGHPLDSAALAEIAASLGSDVPAFLCGTASRCFGRGEIVEPLLGPKAPPPLTLLLVKPPFPVSTGWAYKTWASMRAANGGIPSEPLRQLLPGGLELRNDLEPPVFHKHLILQIARDWLRERDGVLAALMSGSGSTLFAVLSDPAEAEPLRIAFLENFGDSWWSAISRWIPPVF